jgi:hypothetical protein
MEFDLKAAIVERPFCKVDLADASDRARIMHDVGASI